MTHRARAADGPEGRALGHRVTPVNREGAVVCDAQGGADGPRRSACAQLKGSSADDGGTCIGVVSSENQRSRACLGESGCDSVGDDSAERQRVGRDGDLACTRRTAEREGTGAEIEGLGPQEAEITIRGDGVVVGIDQAGYGTVQRGAARDGERAGSRAEGGGAAQGEPACGERDAVGVAAIRTRKGEERGGAVLFHSGDCGAEVSTDERGTCTSAEIADGASIVHAPDRVGQGHAAGRPVVDGEVESTVNRAQKRDAARGIRADRAVRS